MGNDGGSIVKRDWIQLKSKGEKADKENQNRARWTTCALSKKSLRHPIVACPLGKLYNKDALLEFLLVPASASTPVAQTPFGADGVATAGHIRSLKDVIELKLTPNPDYGKDDDKAAQQAGAQSFNSSRWICPLSQREINGSVRFVAVKHCQNVVSEAAFKEMNAVKSKDASSSSTTPQVCGVCGEELKPGQEQETLLLNPTDKDEIERIAAAWEEIKRQQKAAKKAKKVANGDDKGSKKRKSEAIDGQDRLENEQELKDSVKRARASGLINAPPTSQSGAPRLPMAVAQALEAKKQHTSVIKELYTKDESKKQTWMTMSAPFRR